MLIGRAFRQLRIGAIIFAAGASRRMGLESSKLLLEFDGEQLVRRTARTAISVGLAPVVVVLGAHSQDVHAVLEDLPLEFIVNRQWQKGMSTSVRAGVRHIEKQEVDACILLAADQPFVTTTLLSGICECFAENRKGNRGDAAVVPTYAGRRGNPVLFPASLLPLLKKLQGDAGARQLFDELPIIEYPLSDGNAFIDIDTPEHYATNHSL